METTTENRSWARQIWDNSASSLRANLVPGLLLQVAALGLVLVYYFVEPARPAFDTVAGWKRDGGYLFSGISTAVFGGIIPFAYLWFSKKVPPGRVASIGLFYVLYWAWRGVEVDALYRFQAWLFGSQVDFWTVARKVAVDQFVYSVFWAAIITAVFYGWKNSGFTVRSFRSRFRRRLVTHEAPGVVLATWMVWIPTTAIIYSLPLPLQVPLFNLALCFFVLMVAALGEDRR